MAQTLHFLTSTTLILIFLSTTKSHSFSRKLSPESIGLKQEKLTHLHFYFHDIITSKNPTAIPVTKPGTNSSTLFGTIFIADDPLTAGPDINSKRIGNAQGMFASASQTDVEFLMVFNFVFTEGKYNGSTLSLLGHNAIFSGVREMSIVGGSRVFRFARGYAQARTHTIDLKTNNAIVEYNVYVFHY
ncbi:dirigent protein 22 [Ricinus communis]|uniref:Dirigent protein n=1 Tax=Ricinus communis TaxID=3988 RepID=B9TI64_RICCO|nr:dirigent protein 22 [Ricinus communis]EEF24450.1 Disease resistance response protein, putative [Ricinus communis]|eukprot:XP_002537933.1 dirigent protein 22 [Ricinus communis]